MAVSPFGARLLLSLLWAGARGETRTEIGEMLGLDESTAGNADGYESGGKPFGHSTVMKREDEEFLAESSIWCDKGFELDQEYQRLVESKYWSEVRATDFNAIGSVDEINEWVYKKTNGRISKIVNELTGQGPMLAVNAVYFKGRWQEPFEERLTRDEKFTLPNGTERQVLMMRLSDEFEYEEAHGTQIVRLPYRGTMYMAIVLPPKGPEFSKFCKEMRGTLGTDWTLPLGRRQGTLRLPRFRLESDMDLKDALQSMGMRRAFDRGAAEFDGITGIKPFFVGGVRQSDFVEVNEKGTEAAAVTSEMMCLAAMDGNPLPPFEMVVNRPFVFAICERLTGAVVFMGAVVEP